MMTLKICEGHAGSQALRDDYLSIHASIVSDQFYKN